MAPDRAPLAVCDCKVMAFDATTDSPLYAVQRAKTFAALGTYEHRKANLGPR